MKSALSERYSGVVASAATRRPPFIRALLTNVAGLLLVLSIALLATVAWNDVSSTRRAAQDEITGALDRVTERITLLTRAAEMTAGSLERAARMSPVASATLRQTIESSLAAFEQRPELSYIGLVLPATGEYGNLERTDDGTVLLWLFPGTRKTDPVVRTFALTGRGFVLRDQHAADGYDPRLRPFYRAAVTAPARGTWMPVYQWVVHSSHSEPLWGFSYVKALRNDTGQLLGVLDADFDMPALNRILRQLGTEYGATVQLVELGATPLLIGDPSLTRVPVPAPAELRQLANRTGNGGDTVVKRTTLHGRERWVAARRVQLPGGGSWLIVTSKAAPLIAPALRRQLFEVFGMGVSLGAVLLLALMRMARRFGRPLAALEQHVERIEKFGLGAARDTVDGGFRETQRLARAFDRMAAALRHRESRLRHLALHDELTGLPNRNSVPDLIAADIDHARRVGHRVALFYIDLDRFKTINDGYGHAFGDAVLKAASQRLAELVRSGDTLARHGGDEFLVLMNGIHSTDDARAIASQLIASLDRPLTVQDRQISLSGSIGVSIFPQDGETAADLIRHADMAMFRAKNLGRNNCQFFSQALSAETLLRTRLETQLRSAIESGSLSLLYQPKVRLADGHISGCEALLRWRHPELGQVSPAVFIPIAEESGLILPLSDWVLKTACTQARHWLGAGLPAVRVAVNISARQFLQQDVAAWALRTLDQAGVPPSCLELELTESVLAQDLDKVTTTFNILRAAGVTIAIDDFGTGHSSLSYLKRFRVDTLKIDQSFVHGMLDVAEDSTIVRAVITLAHNLGYRVIAEGVDSQPRCDFLREHGCDEIQGYWFSEPVSAAQFTALLRSGQRLR